MSRYAAIDIGSNSLLLLIVEPGADGELCPLVDTKESLRLAAGIAPGERIGEAAIERMQTVLDHFAEQIRKAEADQVLVAATQLFRAAGNGREVADWLGQRYGWDITIPAGEEEARLSYLAAASGMEGVPPERLVIDIGGGSTEIIHGRDRDIINSESFPVGAVGLTGQHGLSGKATADAYEAAVSEVAGVFRRLKQVDFPLASYLVLVGGTAMTLAALRQGAKKFDPEVLHGVEFSSTWMQERALNLAQMTLNERERLIPFDTERAAILSGGCAIVDCLLRILRPERIRVSNRGLRWGLLVDRLAAGFGD